MNQIELTRRELYDLVWSESILSLSKKYKLSDNGFRKLCKRMNIPMPRVGHWQKIAARRKVWVGTFPEKFAGKDKIILQLRDPDDPSSQLQNEIRSMENDPAFKIPKELADPDPLIVEAKNAWGKNFKSLRRDNDVANCWPVLTVVVSPLTADRAFRIMDTLIKVLRKRGHDTIMEEQTHVVIGTEKIRIVLRELTTMSKDENERWSVYTPSGKLCFKIEETLYGRLWQDRKTQLEDQLPSIVAKLELTGREMEARRKEWERIQREEAEVKRIKQERKDREEKELKDFRELMSQAIRWQQLTLLKSFISDMEKMGPRSNFHLDDMDQWLEWARKKIDWFDPSINAEDDLMKNVDKDTLTCPADGKEVSNTRFYEPSTGENYFRKPFWRKG